MIGSRLSDVENHQRDSDFFGFEGESKTGVNEQTRAQDQQTVALFEFLTAKVFRFGRDVVPEEDDVGLHDADPAVAARRSHEVFHLIVCQLNVAVGGGLRFGEKRSQKIGVSLLQRALKLDTWKRGRKPMKSLRVGHAF